MMTAAEMYQHIAASDNGFLVILLVTLGAMALAWLALRMQNRVYPEADWSIPFPSLKWMMLLGLVARLPALFRPFWYDEIFSANIAMIPRISDLFIVIKGDVHPPLFYLLLWLWAQLVGHAPLLLRCVPLLFGMLCIPMAHHLIYVLRDKDHNQARLAALVAALLPALIHYSAELRGYSLLVYLVLYALLAIVDKRPRTFAIALALIPLTHNIGYLYMLVLMGIAIHKNGWLWIRHCLPAMMNALIWLPFLLMQSRDVANGFWLPPLTIGGFFRPIAEMTMYQSPAPGVAFLWGGAIAFTALSFWMLRKDHRVRIFFALIIPVSIGLAVASLVWKPVYLPRVLLPLTFLIALMWAWASARRPLLQWALILMLCVGGIAYRQISYNDVQTPLSVCDGLPVFAADVPSALYARFYLSHSIVSIWDQANDNNQSLSDDAKAAFGFQQRSQPGSARCVIAFDTPLTRTEERDLIAALTGEHSRTEFNEFFDLVVIRS